MCDGQRPIRWVSSPISSDLINFEMWACRIVTDFIYRTTYTAHIMYCCFLLFLHFLARIMVIKTIHSLSRLRSLPKTKTVREKNIWEDFHTMQTYLILHNRLLVVYYKKFKTIAMPHRKTYTWMDLSFRTAIKTTTTTNLLARARNAISAHSGLIWLHMKFLSQSIPLETANKIQEHIYFFLCVFKTLDSSAFASIELSMFEITLFSTISDTLHWMYCRKHVLQKKNWVMRNIWCYEYLCGAINQCTGLSVKCTIIIINAKATYIKYIYLL